MCHYASEKKCTASASKCTKNRLMARLSSDALQNTALPQPLAGFMGGRGKKGEGEGQTDRRGDLSYSNF